MQDMGLLLSFILTIWKKEENNSGSNLITNVKRDLKYTHKCDFKDIYMSHGMLQVKTIKKTEKYQIALFLYISEN